MFNMKKSRKKFKVGEWVRIRDWDDMEQEFGLYDNKHIDTPEEVFVITMRPLCGMYMHIKSVNGKFVQFDNQLCGIAYRFRYTVDMIEHIPDYQVGDIVRVRDLDDILHNWGAFPTAPLGNSPNLAYGDMFGKTYLVYGVDNNNVFINENKVSKLLVERAK